MNDKELKIISKDFTNEMVKTLLSKVPFLGTFYGALNSSLSDIKLEDRFELLNKKLEKACDEIKNSTKQIESLKCSDRLLLKDSLDKLLFLYNKAAFEKRREYLANAILNTITLKNDDYQRNSFYEAILDSLPDISIEFINIWVKKIKKPNIFLNVAEDEFGKENFNTLRKNYKTDMSFYEVVLNCANNGLLKITEESFYGNPYDNPGTNISVTEISVGLLKFIKEN